MKLSKSKRQAIVNAQKVIETIGKMAKSKDRTNGEKVNLAELTKKLSDRREKVLSGKDSI